MDEVKEKLILARQRLEAKRAIHKLRKPLDISGYINLGARMKGLQQAIDIVESVNRPHRVGSLTKNP